MFGIKHFDIQNERIIKFGVDRIILNNDTTKESKSLRLTND